MLHWLLGKYAKGVPNVLVSTEPGTLLEIAAGRLPAPRGQNQTLMAVLVRSMAYQPPPLLLKEGP